MPDKTFADQVIRSLDPDFDFSMKTEADQLLFNLEGNLDAFRIAFGTIFGHHKGFRSVIVHALVGILVKEGKLALAQDIHRECPGCHPFDVPLPEPLNVFPIPTSEEEKEKLKLLKTLYLTETLQYIRTL